MMFEKMSKQIYLPKWTELVVALYNTPSEQRYNQKLHRTIAITTRHLRTLISDLEDMGIATTTRKSKIKYIALTEKGEKVAESLLQIYPALKQDHTTCQKRPHVD